MTHAFDIISKHRARNPAKHCRRCGRKLTQRLLVREHASAGSGRDSYSWWVNFGVVIAARQRVDIEKYSELSDAVRSSFPPKLNRCCPRLTSNVSMIYCNM